MGKLLQNIFIYVSYKLIQPAIFAIS